MIFSPNIGWRKALTSLEIYKFREFYKLFIQVNTLDISKCTCPFSRGETHSFNSADIKINSWLREIQNAFIQLYLYQPTETPKNAPIKFLKKSHDKIFKKASFWYKICLILKNWHIFPFKAWTVNSRYYKWIHQTISNNCWTSLKRQKKSNPK